MNTYDVLYQHYNGRTYYHSIRINAMNEQQAGRIALDRLSNEQHYRDVIILRAKLVEENSNV